MRGKYGIEVCGETYLGFSTVEMLDWVTLFHRFGAGEDSDAFAGAPCMTVRRIATDQRTLALTTTAMRRFSRATTSTQRRDRKQNRRTHVCEKNERIRGAGGR